MSAPLTRKGAATRERIVTGAATLLRERGVDQVSLDDIRAATATSKSQLFHYFPDGRSQLLLAVARHEAQQVLLEQEPQLSDLGPPGSWSEWRDVVIARYERQGTRCPMSALTRQLAPSHPEVGAVVAGLLTEWQRRIEAGLARAGVEQARTRAIIILAALQGGISLLLATGDSTALRVALDAAIADLLETPSGAP
ncbi:TetR/AcrR family transcriptional regulator [Dactylosporangium fulvum]|uniref:TetR/AcrR family transcriptional regulator n=1 Tax=Dactylosporangium fulvum TaxID=53359 RepID=A0ABY5VWH2_9ACTN|nr:TetR/AcrR family transcriptional regulator [Dactylosporangium fulvum]UWP82083.1 TetR/AcrR family transcriptional regulator [Dactylosporangium fulvum]